MSEVRVNLHAPEEGARDQEGPLTDPVTSPNDEASSSGMQSQPPSDDSSPSPAEEFGLLSLPWELVTHIASHLPAQCVMAVLPKVCQTLGNVRKDNNAWQLRARTLIGSTGGFPVGPKEDFDWPSACLELEHFITCWTDLGRRMEGRSHEDEERRAGRDVGEGGREGEVEEVGPAEQEVALGVDGGVEDELGELQPVGEELLARFREVLRVRPEEGEAAAQVEEQRDNRIVLDGALNHRDPGILGNGRHAEVEQPHPRSPSPPPALERISLASNHIAAVNSVLLMGGEGKVCATASRDANVKVWDLQRGPGGALLHTLVGQGDFSTHQGWAWCLARRGPLLASGGFDSVVKLWDLQAGGAGRGLIRAGAAVLCLCYQSNMLLTGTFDRRVSMYDTRAAEPLVKSLHLHGKAVMCLAADDDYIISGSQDYSVAVYDCRAGKMLKKVRLSSYLMSMSYSGREVWAGDNSGTLHSFSMQAGTFKPVSKFNVGHTDLITGIHRSSGSLYTCSSDSTVKVHIPCAPPRTLCTIKHNLAIHGLSVEAGVLAVASGDVGVEVWRPRNAT